MDVRFFGFVWKPIAEDRSVPSLVPPGQQETAAIRFASSTPPDVHRPRMAARLMTHAATPAREMGWPELVLQRPRPVLALKNLDELAERAVRLS